MKTIVASLVALFIAGSAVGQTAVDYRFDDVKRKVVLTKAKQEWRVEKGQHAQSGDKVQTGWFSYALIAAEAYRARFEIFSSTDVQLASGTPGVILSLERGRIRAAFDKIVGNDPRIVQTPGALLAVRGTKYDVEVDNAGRTTVDVWEGIVELRSTLLAEPLLVHAGQESVFGRRQPPMVQPMPDDRRRNDPNRPGGSYGPGRGPHGAPPPADGHDHHPPQPGSHSGGGPGTPPPPPPPKP